MTKIRNLNPHQEIKEELIIRAINGEGWAANNVLNFLGSPNPQTCKEIERAIRQVRDSNIWQHLLHYLANRQWDRLSDGERYYFGEASQRIDQSIVEVFVQDVGKEEKFIKEKILQQSMEDTDPRVRQASGFISGLRGDQRAIHILAETVDSGSRKWQLRAVKALGVIKDARCGPPLIKALIKGRDRLHREARRALQNLGLLAKEAWLEALDHPDAHVRWHAARGLAEIGDLRAISAMAEGLFDESYAVRWATANVFSQIGAQAVLPIITALGHHEVTEPARNAICQALQGVNSIENLKKIEPLLNALHRPVGTGRLPVIAKRLLNDWEKADMKSTRA